MLISLLVSLPRESRYFFEQLNFKEEQKANRVFYTAKYREHEIILLHTHCGPVNAAACTEAIIQNYQPDIIIKTGSGGAHRPELLPGDVLIGTNFRIMYNPAEFADTLDHAKMPKLIRFYKYQEDVKFDELTTSAELTALLDKLTATKLGPIYTQDNWHTDTKYRNPIIKVGTVGSNEAWTTDAGLISRKRALFGQDVEDKESAYIAQVCKLHKVPFLAFIGVSDNELIFKQTNRDAIRQAIEDASRNAALVTLEFIKAL